MVFFSGIEGAAFFKILMIFKIVVFFILDGNSDITIELKNYA